MKPHSPRLLLLVLGLVTPIFAQTPDFTLDPGSGSIIAKGTNLTLDADATKLIAVKPSPVNVQLFGYDGTISNPCTLSDNDRIQLGQSSVYTDLTVGSSLIVKTYQSSWMGFLSSDPRYSAFKVPGYSVTDYYFKVTDGGGTAKCVNELGNDLSAAYLRINASPLPATVHGQGDTDDPPIPMVGGSLRLWAPKYAKFTCDAQSAMLEGITRVVRLETPAEPFVYLDGISDWRITAYPQQLEITPGRSHTLKFSVSGNSKLDCATGKYLNVSTGSDTRPLEFVVDWSPGWFRSRRNLEIPCGQCLLLLRTARKQ